MLSKLVEARDVTSGTFLLLFIATSTATVLLFAGTAWVPRRWKLVVALSGVATLGSALHYLMASDIWVATGHFSMLYRYAGWFMVIPVQVLSLYFFARAIARVTVGVFWRLLVAAILMVLARYMGEAGFMHPTLGFLISLAAWLYVLGEAYFGQMAEMVARRASEVAARGYFWMRLILTVGWAIWPLCYFIMAYGGAAPAGLIVPYNLADLVDVVALSLIVLTVGVLEAGG